MAYSMQNGVGRPGPFYHMDDVSVDRGGKGRHSTVTHFTYAFFVLSGTLLACERLSLGQKLQE